MSRFLGLIMLAAMALFIAGPAVAQNVDNGNAWTVEKSYTYDKISGVGKSTEITVTKEVDITVEGNLDATGGIDVQGDVVFKEMDVEVQDEEVVNKFFELDDSATSRWTIVGEGVMNVAERLQNGFDNVGLIDQNPGGSGLDQMNVALQYQIGNANISSITQGPTPNKISNNFAKEIQIGDLNIGTTLQNQ